MSKRKISKSYRVTKRKKSSKKKSSFLAMIFDKYISLFAVPIFVIIYALVFVQRTNIGGWEGLIAGIWILFAIIGAIIIGIFSLLNRYWLKWELNWWKNLILSVVLFLLGSFIFAAIIRLSV